MRFKLFISLTIATAATVPGFASATGMFCDPGQDWTTVDSGTIEGQGWGVVNFTKPEGGEMRAVWTLEDFEDGPALAGTWFGVHPEDIQTGARHHVTPGGMDASARIESEVYEGGHDFSVDPLEPAASSSKRVTLTLAAGASGESLHLIHFIARNASSPNDVRLSPVPGIGNSADPPHLSWSLQVDNCLEGKSPMVLDEQGEGATFLSPRDFEGPASANARAADRLAPAAGGSALIEAKAQAVVGGTPFLDLVWVNHGGEIVMDGPSNLTLRDLWCTQHDGETFCQGWGRETVPWSEAQALLPGEYNFEATGLTDPTQNPGESTAGPYIALVPTHLPPTDQEA